MIAALYVAKNGIYWNRPGVDAWDEDRDARKYAGPYRVIAHPPCARWCQLARMNEVRYGLKVGDDKGCFEAALKAVRQFGGVLEHPAYSLAWPRFDLTRPDRSGWKQAGPREWVCEVSQAAYGHRARKLTWLLYVGDNRPQELDWSRPAAKAWVSWGGFDKYPTVERLGKKESLSTPPAFADILEVLASSK